MYEDKILVCKECGNEFTFTLSLIHISEPTRPY